MAISITPNYIAGYKPNHKTQKSDNRLNNLLQNNEKQYNGYLSEKAKRNIRKKAVMLCYMKKHKRTISSLRYGKNIQVCKKNTHKKTNRNVSFLTLTLPAIQKHTDNEIKRRCLQPFLAILKSLYKLNNYIWSAETQNNGNIHFHIILDCYVDKNEIRKNWLKCLNYLGYWKRAVIENPPCSHIESIKDSAGLGQYITKYITKGNTGKRKITGRLWGCSEELEKITTLTMEDEEAICYLEEIKQATRLYYEDEHFNISYLNIEDCPRLHLILLTHIAKCIKIYKT